MVTLEDMLKIPEVPSTGIPEKLLKFCPCLSTFGLLSQKCQTEWLKQQSFFSPRVPEAKCKSKVLAGSVSGENQLPGSRMAVFLLTWKKDIALVSSSPYKGLHCHGFITSSWTHFLKPSHWELDFKYKF